MQQLSGQCVLIVENHEDTRLLFQEVFIGEGARVKSAASAIEAIPILSLYEPDLVVCDIVLPQWDGYALLKYIRARQLSTKRKIPVMAVTAFDEGELQERIMQAGFDGFLRKPVDLDQLVTQAAELVQRNQLQPDDRHWYQCFTRLHELFCLPTSEMEITGT